MYIQGLFPRDKIKKDGKILREELGKWKKRKEKKRKKGRK